MGINSAVVLGAKVKGTQNPFAAGADTGHAAPSKTLAQALISSAVSSRSQPPTDLLLLRLTHLYASDPRRLSHLPGSAHALSDTLINDAVLL